MMSFVFYMHTQLQAKTETKNLTVAFRFMVISFVIICIVLIFYSLWIGAFENQLEIDRLCYRASLKMEWNDATQGWANSSAKTFAFEEQLDGGLLECKYQCKNIWTSTNAFALDV